MRFLSSWRDAAPRAAAVLALLTAGCSDLTSFQPDSPATTNERLVVVLNAESRSLTLVPLGSSNIRRVGLGSEGTPTTLAVRGERALVPMGSLAAVKVVNLRTLAVEHTVALPAGSGATGAAFLNDSIAVIGNPLLNSVTSVNLLRGTSGATVAVGVHPRTVGVSGNRAYVLNANLNAATLQPNGPGSVTVLDQHLGVVGTVPLSGIRPASLAFRGQEVFVLNAGTWNGNNSSLSTVDQVTLSETRVQAGMGNYLDSIPGGLATLAGHYVYVASYGAGLVVYDPDARALLRSPASALVPGDLLPVAAVEMDEMGMLYTVHPGNCTQPGKVQQVTTAGGVVGQADVEMCPVAVALTRLGGG